MCDNNEETADQGHGLGSCTHSLLDGKGSKYALCGTSWSSTVDCRMLMVSAWTNLPKKSRASADGLATVQLQILQ